MALTETAYCSNSNGYALGTTCITSTGGVLKFGVSQFSGTSVFQYGSDNTITAMTLNPTYYIFDQVLESSSAMQKEIVSLTNSSSYWEQTVEVQLPKGSASIRNQIMGLSNQASRISVYDNNGDILLYGIGRGMYVTEVNWSSGKNIGDGTPIIIKFTGKENKPANYISGATISGYNTSY